MIDAIELFHVAVPLTRPLPGCGKRLETVLVRVESAGVSGWGEASPGAAPEGRHEWAGGVFTLLSRWIAPSLVGAAIDPANDLEQHLSRFRGNSFAKGALDCAWWDLEARRQEKTLAACLGATRRAVGHGVSLAEYETVDALLEAIGQALTAGATHVTLKLGPAWELEVIRAVRQVFPLEPIRVDFGGVGSLDRRDLFFRLEDFSLAALEQPLDLDDLIGHAMLQETLRTSICLDESITSAERAAQAIDLGACRAMNIQPDSAGGLTQAMAIRDAAREKNIGLTVAAGPRTGVGAAAALALAMLEGFDATLDVPPLAPALAPEHAALWPAWLSPDESGLIVPWQAPGIGFVPDLELVRRLSIATAEFRKP